MRRLPGAAISVQLLFCMLLVSEIGVLSKTAKGAKIAKGGAKNVLPPSRFDRSPKVKMFHKDDGQTEAADTNGDGYDKADDAELGARVPGQREAQKYHFVEATDDDEEESGEEEFEDDDGDDESEEEEDDDSEDEDEFDEDEDDSGDNKVDGLVKAPKAQKFLDSAEDPAKLDTMLEEGSNPADPKRKSGGGQPKVEMAEEQIKKQDLFTPSISRKGTKVGDFPNETHSIWEHVEFGQLLYLSVLFAMIAAIGLSLCKRRGKSRSPAVSVSSPSTASSACPISTIVFGHGFAYGSTSAPCTTTPPCANGSVRMGLAGTGAPGQVLFPPNLMQVQCNAQSQAQANASQTWPPQPNNTPSCPSQPHSYSAAASTATSGQNWGSQPKCAATAYNNNVTAGFQNPCPPQAQTQWSNTLPFYSAGVDTRAKTE